MPARRIAKSELPRPRLLPIAAPMFVELILGIGVGLVSTALAARLSDTSAAAFSLAHHVFAMLFILFRVVGAGVGVVVAQCLGGGRREVADAVARAALGASTWMGLLTALPALLLAVPLMQGLNAPAAVVPLAAPFLQALAPAMVLDAWNASMSTVLRTHLRTREALAVVVAMHMVHLAGALVLMPALGLPGYAWALLASRLFGVVVHLVLWRRLLGLRVLPSDAWQLRRNELAEVVRIGLPGAAENVAWRLAFMVSVSVAGTMGAAALATQAYVQQLGYLVVMASLAIGLSVEILVGHLVGQGACMRRTAWCGGPWPWGSSPAWRWRWRWPWPDPGCWACSRRMRTSWPPAPCCCGGRCCSNLAAPSTWWSSMPCAQPVMRVTRWWRVRRRCWWCWRAAAGCWARCWAWGWWACGSPMLPTSGCAAC